MELLLSLPDTVDPSMVDQLTSAVQRMGGKLSVAPEDEGAPEGPPPGEEGLRPDSSRMGSVRPRPQGPPPGPGGPGY